MHEPSAPQLQKGLKNGDDTFLLEPLMMDQEEDVDPMPPVIERQ